MENVKYRQLALDQAEEAPPVPVPLHDFPQGSRRNRQRLGLEFQRHMAPQHDQGDSYGISQQVVLQTHGVLAEAVGKTPAENRQAGRASAAVASVRTMTL